MNITKSFYIVFIILLIISCSDKKGQSKIVLDKNVINNEDSITYSSEYFENIDGVSSFSCFDYVPFPEVLNANTVDSLYPGVFNCQKEVLTNMYDSTKVDTIFNFKFETNAISLYRTDNRYFLLNIILTDSTLQILDGLRPSMSKKRLAKKFKIDQVLLDTVDISYDFESYVRIVFEGDKAKQVNVVPYFD